MLNRKIDTKTREISVSHLKLETFQTPPTKRGGHFLQPAALAILVLGLAQEGIDPFGHAPHVVALKLRGVGCHDGLTLVRW